MTEKDVYTTQETHPVCFISYAEKDNNIDWILSLAERLRENGVNVRLYEWDKFERLDLPKYMEQRINESDYTVIVCTPEYARKADARIAGVGYETTIITGNLYQMMNYEKVIPILRGKKDDSIPSYLQSTNYIDMRDDSDFDEKFDELLRTIYKARKYQIPPLGSRPELPKRTSNYPGKLPAPSKLAEERYKAFGDEIAKDNWIVKKSNGNTPKILLGISPLDIENGKKFDFDEDQIKKYLQPICSSSWDTRTNERGILSSSPKGNLRSYVLIRWDGTIEAYDERMMGSPEMNGDNRYKTKLLSIKDFKSFIIERVRNYAKSLKESGVKFPIEVRISLIGVKDFCAVELGYDALESPIMPENLDLEPCVIENLDDIETALMPALDSLARACGISKYSKIDRKQ